MVPNVLCTQGIFVQSDVERYGRLVDMESQSPGFLAAPPPAEWERVVSHFPSALELIDRADPRLRSEFDEMVGQVVVAVPRSAADSRRFGSVSPMMLWGAVMINAECHATPLDVAAGLVHETAHHLLFALSREEPLVANAIEDSFSSPLRADARPMDGVFHATFVCARLHYFHDRLHDAGGVKDEDRRAAAGARDRYRKRFASGLETVREHARLTASGAHVMAAASAAVGQTG